MTAPGFALRDARPGDAGAVVALVRAGFDAELVRAFVYGCHGVERYVREQISARDAGADTVYSVAESDEGRVVGCVEMRVLSDRLYLNYISVADGFRAARLGTRLLDYAIRRDLREGHRLLALDVLEHNAPARRWYDGLGMAHEASTIWYARPLGDGAHEGPAGLVSGLPQARVLQRELGFSQVRVTVGDRGYDVGMLGDAWFRTTSAEAMGDPRLLAALRRVDPARELLALVPEGAPAHPAARRITATHRLSAPIDGVCARLNAAPAPAHPTKP